MVTLTEEILNRKLYFLRTEYYESLLAIRNDSKLILSNFIDIEQISLAKDY